MSLWMVLMSYGAMIYILDLTILILNWYTIVVLNIFHKQKECIEGVSGWYFTLEEFFFDISRKATIRQQVKWPWSELPSNIWQNSVHLPFHELLVSLGSPASHLSPSVSPFFFFHKKEILWMREKNGVVQEDKGLWFFYKLSSNTKQSREGKTEDLVGI